MSFTSREVAMSELLGACAAELASAAQDCSRLQDALSPALLGGAVDGLDAQALDAVTQALEAMSQYLARLSQAAPPAWRLDPSPAAAALPLAGLAGRLIRQEIAAQPPGADLELFD